MSLIRFDNEDFVFDPKDFELKDPTEYTSVGYKPITSRLTYKGGDFLVRFPIQFGYGISIGKSGNKEKEDNFYSFSYYKKEESVEDKRFVTFINEFEKWCKKEITRVAKQQLKLHENNQPAVFSENLSKNLSKEKNLVKPFFCFPKNPDTKKIDETKNLRHYIKFDSTKSGPECSVHSLNDLNNILRPDDILSTDNDKKTGQFVILVKFKGVFFKVLDDYSAILQTVGKTVCYRPNLGFDPMFLMGADYKPMLAEEDDDEVFEKKMLQKLAK
jgi:hypothetical protein